LDIDQYFYKANTASILSVI